MWVDWRKKKNGVMVLICINFVKMGIGCLVVLSYKGLCGGELKRTNLFGTIDCPLAY